MLTPTIIAILVPVLMLLVILRNSTLIFPLPVELLRALIK